MITFVLIMEILVNGVLKNSKKLLKNYIGLLNKVGLSFGLLGMLLLREAKLVLVLSKHYILRKLD